MYSRNLIALILAALLVPCAVLTGAAATKKKSSTTKKTATTSKKKTTTTKKTTATAKKGTSKKGRTSTKKSAAQSWRSRQLAPTPERYRDIQQALIEKGYLQPPASGKWDQSSTDALRRFQQEQNLEPNGKLDSLSIIALGLGPKYDSTANASTLPPAPRP